MDTRTYYTCKIIGFNISAGGFAVYLTEVNNAFSSVPFSPPSGTSAEGSGLLLQGILVMGIGGEVTIVSEDKVGSGAKSGVLLQVQNVNRG
ncbi:MAG: hypothetical protein AAGA77_12645 [Bacteroidota bacterium]